MMKMNLKIDNAETTRRIKGSNSASRDLDVEELDSFFRMGKRKLAAIQQVRRMQFKIRLCIVGSAEGLSSQWHQIGVDIGMEVPMTSLHRFAERLRRCYMPKCSS